MRCRVGGFGYASVSAGCGKRSRHAAANLKAGGDALTSSWQCCGRSGTTGRTASPIAANSSSSRTPSVARNPLPASIFQCTSAVTAKPRLDRPDGSAALGRDPASIEVSLGHSVTKVDSERAERLAAQGADRLVLAMPPTTDLEQAKDELSACAPPPFLPT